MGVATYILSEKMERIPFFAIASLLSVSKATITQQWKRSKKGLFPRGRRSVLSEEILAQMFHCISVGFEPVDQPAMLWFLTGYIYTEHHLSVFPHTLRHVIRCTHAFKTVLGIPIESGRCQVTVEAIQEHCQQLAAEIENVPAVFIFNADESGFQDFVNAREVQVIVPAAFEYDSIGIPNNRS
jgi:hypothetical protein